MPKDRSRRVPLARDVEIAIERSSAHPVRYAIVLLAQRGGAWYAVRTFDNAHDDPEEHHEHAYIGDQKQPPTITRCAVNEAMYAAEVKLRANWSDIVSEWDCTR